MKAPQSTDFVRIFSPPRGPVSNLRESVHPPERLVASTLVRAEGQMGSLGALVPVVSGLVVDVIVTGAFGVAFRKVEIGAEAPREELGLCFFERSGVSLRGVGSDQACQFSTSSSCTRRNSASFSVTSVSPRERA